ncbi:hypothetical protein LCGC14_0016160 [marine sediment metagenome]|uniref:Glycosyltransferase RgtA/B/C/D-like domain-containing protein n=1 Tax=marine sediment metagenome TaxID=412755 RepID=A0A0F9W442_9ZZZZ|nr:hypothetical protein [Phycisphaerae bacterium]HDZ42828.1 hypothetical protein [Phycisphaerae bacterium]
MTVIACVCAAALIGALAYRPITTVDLGYHLACGQEFLRTGRIVQDDTFIYPPLDPVTARGHELTPGSYFDQEGQYHSPNVNWFSQVVLGLLWQLGGWTAMNISLWLLVAAIAVGQMALLRRLNVSWAWLPLVWLTTAIIGHERFMLRPELFAYVCLLVQLYLLVGHVSWAAVGVCVVVQLLAVNLHSFWPMGVAIVCAFAADAAARGLYIKVVQRRSVVNELRSRVVRLAVCLALVVAAGMLHPAGPSNVTFPFRTVEFLHRQKISGDVLQEGMNLREAYELRPWGFIPELRPPFGAGWWRNRTLRALAALLMAATVGGVLLLMYRRWALAALLAGFSVAGLLVWRNIAFSAIFGAPLIARGVQDLWRRRSQRQAAHTQADTETPQTTTSGTRFIRTCGLAVVALLSVYWLHSVVTNDFYVRGRPQRSYRFGHGYNKLIIPIGTCRWLDEHLPRRQPILTDLPSSSSLVFFSDKVTGAPSATNGWAITPRRMGQVMALSRGAMPIAKLDEWELNVAVVPADGYNAPLADALQASPQWALVHVEPSYVVFARHTKANAALIAANKVTGDNFDTRAFIELCRSADPVATSGLATGAGMLQRLGLRDQAKTVWRACVAEPLGRELPEPWVNLGTCLADRGRERLLTGDRGGMADLQEARECFRQALRLRRGDPHASERLQRVETDIAWYSRVGEARP